VTKTAVSAQAHEDRCRVLARATLQVEVAIHLRATPDSREVNVRRCQFKSTGMEFNKESFQFLAFQSVRTQTCKRALMDISTISKLREEAAVVVAVQEQEVAAMN
jgi:hypothetical protein